jgi:hypothetical protein
MQAKLEVEQRKREELEAVQVFREKLQNCKPLMFFKGAAEGLGAERGASAG